MTIVLIHGSTQNAWCWDLVRSELPDSVAVDLPADRPEFTASDFARLVADQIDDDSVVVAHSASGMLLPIIAQLRRVHALVYLAAMIPAVGLSGLAQYQREPDMLAPDWIAAGRDWADRAKWRTLAERFLFHDVDAKSRVGSFDASRDANGRHAARDLQRLDDHARTLTLRRLHGRSNDQSAMAGTRLARAHESAARADRLRPFATHRAVT